MKKNKLPHLIIGSLLITGATAASAVPIIYNDFSDVSGLTLNGSAAGLTTNPDNTLRLTNDFYQSGSAFSTNAIALNSNMSFSTAFSFNISDSKGFSDSDGVGADGLAFVLQTNGNTAGGNGGGIGYMGINNSLAIEFDTWDNVPWDNNDGNHVGINLNGDVNSVVQASVSTRMNNGLDWFAWIDYNGASDLLEVRLAQLDLRPTTALLAYTVDLTTILNSTSAYAGFSSGTGAGAGQYDILDWQFNAEYAPISTVGQIPSPAPLALILIGALSIFRFKKKL